jgi:Fe-S-cluster containining protein
MILTQDDLTRIEALGYDRSEFLLPTEETEGFLQLRNVSSPFGDKCYFLSEEGECTIYNDRPRGCALYPLILNLDTNEEMIDEDCREREWFREQTYHQSQIISINELVSRLMLENSNY